MWGQCAGGTSFWRWAFSLVFGAACQSRSVTILKLSITTKRKSHNKCVPAPAFSASFTNEKALKQWEYGRIQNDPALFRLRQVFPCLKGTTHTHTHTHNPTPLTRHRSPHSTLQPIHVRGKVGLAGAGKGREGTQARSCVRIYIYMHILRIQSHQATDPFSSISSVSFAESCTLHNIPETEFLSLPRLMDFGIVGIILYSTLERGLFLRVLKV